MAFVYILKSLIIPKTYVGSTTDPVRRLNEHNSGYSIYSKRYKPWAVIYQEEYDNLFEARKREKYFKSAAGRRFIRKYIYKEV